MSPSLTWHATSRQTLLRHHFSLARYMTPHAPSYKHRKLLARNLSVRAKALELSVKQDVLPGSYALILVPDKRGAEADSFLPETQPLVACWTGRCCAIFSKACSGEVMLAVQSRLELSHPKRHRRAPYLLCLA